MTTEHYLRAADNNALDLAALEDGVRITHRGEIRRGSYSQWQEEFTEAPKPEDELDRARYALKVLIDERSGNGVFGQISRKQYAEFVLQYVDTYLEALAMVEEK